MNRNHSLLFFSVFFFNFSDRAIPLALMGFNLVLALIVVNIVFVIHSMPLITIIVTQVCRLMCAMRVGVNFVLFLFKSLEVHSYLQL